MDQALDHYVDANREFWYKTYPCLTAIGISADESDEDLIEYIKSAQDWMDGKITEKPVDKSGGRCCISFFVDNPDDEDIKRIIPKELDGYPVRLRHSLGEIVEQ